MDALDKKIAEYMSHKNKIPQPECRHEKGDAFKKDIQINGITLIIGGKPLLECATLKLVKGKKYGLIGRNGIGKTCLINAITRGEIEKFPPVHILQVEQETQADETTVLEHVMNCDTERTRLLEEMDQISQLDDKDASEEEKEKIIARTMEISERLECIDAAGCEAKAIKILTGIGF